MGQIILNFPDENETKIIRGTAEYLGYQETINGQPNPETRRQYYKAQMVAFTKNCYRANLANKAAEEARLAAIVAADAETADIS